MIRRKSTKRLGALCLVLVLVMSAFTVMTGFTAGTGEELFEDSEELGYYERYPEDGDDGIPLDENMQTNLSVRVRDDTTTEDQGVNVTFYGSEHGEDLLEIGENLTVADGEWANLTVDNLEYGTEYQWYVNITQYGNEDVYNETEIWSFTTEEILITMNEPIDEAEVNIYDDMSTNLSVTVEHTADKPMNVTFYGNEVGEDSEIIGENTSVPSGNYANYTWEELEYGNEYEWYVIVTEYEREDFYNETDIWTFTTEKVITEIEPEDGAIDVLLGEDMETVIKVNVTHPIGEDMNVTFFGDGDRLDNETVESGQWANYTWEGLEYGTEYNWYVNITYGEEDTVLLESDEWTFTTEHIPWKIREPNYPVDGAENVELNPELNVTAEHPEDMNITVTFYGNVSGEDLEELYNVTVESGEYATYVWEGLDYGTTYDWQVNVSEEDDGNWTLSEMWNFTTEMEPEPDMYNLTLNIQGEGTIEVDGVEVTEWPYEETFEENTEVGLEAIPEEDWVFVEWTGDHEGTASEITITMESDKELTAWFEEAEKAYFEVEITDYDDEVEEGRYITVKYIVENTGEVKGTQDIRFLVDGTEVDRKEDVTIGVGENRTGKFFWEAEVGSHLLTVESEDDEDTVAVYVEGPPGLIPGFTSILLILATVFAAVIYHKKKR